MSRRNNDDLSRFGIYKNKKRQTIYYDKLSKNAYLIQEGDIKKIQAINSRYFLAFSLGVLIYGFLNVDIFISIGLGVCALVGLEFYYRKIFLKSLPPAKNLEGVVIKTAKQSREESPKNVLLMRVILYWLCGIGISVITYFQNYPWWQKVGIWAFALYAIYNGIMNLNAYHAKDKGEE